MILALRGLAALNIRWEPYLILSSPPEAAVHSLCWPKAGLSTVLVGPYPPYNYIVHKRKLRELYQVYLQERDKRKVISNLSEL